MSVHRFTIEGRCFVPFKSFGELQPETPWPGKDPVRETPSSLRSALGGPYSGDARGYSVTQSADSRIHVAADVGTDGSVSPVKSYCDVTIGPGMFVGPRMSSVGEPEATAFQSVIVKNGSVFQVEAHARNPLVYGAPDLDIEARVTITNEMPRVIDVKAQFGSDGFPASEWTLRDASGKAIFLSGFMPDSPLQVFTRIYGPADTVTGTLTMQILLDYDGNFVRVREAKFEGPCGTVKLPFDLSNEPNIDAWNERIMERLTKEGMPLPDTAQRAPERGAATAEFKEWLTMQGSATGMVTFMPISPQEALGFQPLTQILGIDLTSFFPDSASTDASDFYAGDAGWVTVDALDAIDGAAVVDWVSEVAGGISESVLEAFASDNFDPAQDAGLDQFGVDSVDGAWASDVAHEVAAGMAGDVSYVGADGDFVDAGFIGSSGDAI